MKQDIFKQNTILCLDIGGTFIKSANVLNYKIKAIASTKTDISRKRESILESIFIAMDKTIISDVSGIAVSSAGKINPYTGLCIYATDNLPQYSGLDIKNIIESRYNKKTSVINDGQAALLGEMSTRQDLVNNNVIMLTVGTGIGGAYYKNNQIVFGDDYSFGNFGHEILFENGEKCNCGKYGCSEQYLSGTALTRRAKMANLKIMSPKEFADIVNDKNNIDYSIAQKVLDAYLNDFTRFINNLNNAYNVDLIIIGGGVFEHNLDWLDIIKQNSNIKISLAENKNSAGLLGAYEWHKRIYYENK